MAASSSARRSSSSPVAPLHQDMSLFRAASSISSLRLPSRSGSIVRPTACSSTRDMSLPRRVPSCRALNFLTGSRSAAGLFDFCNGGGLDATFMGAGEVDRNGNVNVSRLGGRVIGAGGFIDITQSARLVCFCFSLEGTREKFVNQVEHLTFSAEQARKNNQTVLYVTERAVFRLEPSGLGLIEIAPGLEIKNVLDQIPFPVRVHAPVARMPEDIFRPNVAPFDLPAQPAGKIRRSGAVSSGG